MREATRLVMSLFFVMIGGCFADISAKIKKAVTGERSMQQAVCALATIDSLSTMIARMGEGYDLYLGKFDWMAKALSKSPS